MVAIIMAAGVGSRISRHVDKPKCLLEIEGESILRRTVKMLLHNHISPVVVTGYQHRQIARELQDLQATLLHNPFYRVTNSLGSLWFARDYIQDDEDVILLNADVFWEQDILDILLLGKENALLLADSSVERLEQGDYFFGVHDGTIVKYGKDMKRVDRTHEYVGVGIVRAAFVPVFCDMMQYMMDSEQYNCWWEDILYRCSSDHDVYIRDIAGHFLAEVDYIEDYERIMNYICRRNQGKAAE